VQVVLEPEAASFHCHHLLRQKHKDLSLHVKDKILVADVGGGTVDIVVQVSEFFCDYNDRHY
jgi:molecular chaperone DnaK (HSP70)